MVTSVCHPAAVSAAADLVDLSEPGDSSRNEDQRESPLRRKGSAMSPRRCTGHQETELIRVEGEHLTASPRTTERVSVDTGTAD